MDHVAIMRKSWRLTEKILSGKKSIESRWYKNKYSPWDKIKKGENVYFKDSGDPVTIVAKVKKVIQFEDLTPKKVKEVLNKYREDNGIAKEDIPKFFKRFRDKKYCILIFLSNPQKIKPFNIDKTGFGMMASWIAIDNIRKIKK